MSILLNNPALLWLMALAVIPILVHLFARSRPPQHRFSNIDFFHRILKKTARLRKPQDWLVLILRTLAVAALLFAFLHPLLVSNDPKNIVGAEDNLIIIIDQSASMSAKDGSTSRFTEACNQASALLTKLAPDNANIIWINSTPEASYPSPGPNIAYLKEILQNAEPSVENGAISAAINLAVDQLKDSTGNRQIILISDFQKNAWENAEFIIPESIKFSKLRVAENDLNNLAIESISTSPSSPVSGQDIIVSCRIKNYSSEATPSTLYLNAGGGRQSKQIEVAAWGQTEVEFRTQFSSHGTIPISFSLTEDAYSGDDHRHSVIYVKETLSLYSLTSSQAENTRSAEILGRLASALPWLNHTTVTQLPKLGSCDILFIHHWDGDHFGELESLSNNGTTIIVSPSNKCTLDSLQNLLKLPQTSATLTLQDSDEGWKAVQCADLPIFNVFRNNEFGQAAQGTFNQRYQLPNSWNSQAIIHYSNSKTPAILLNKTFSSPRLIWNLPFDPDLSDWVTQEPFLTFMAELLLSIQPNQNFHRYEQLTGLPLSWVLPENIDPTSITLIPPSGEPWKTTLSHTKQGAALQSELPATPGIYQWRTGSTTAHTSYVNFPATESDLRLLDPAELAQGDSADKGDILRARALERGMPIWQWLLGAVFLLLIAEAFAATTRRHSTS